MCSRKLLPSDYIKESYSTDHWAYFNNIGAFVALIVIYRVRNNACPSGRRMGQAKQPCLELGHMGFHQSKVEEEVVRVG